jgi:hypothetical protein
VVNCITWVEKVLTTAMLLVYLKFMATSIPIKIYEILEDKLGREEAKNIVREIETAVDSIAREKKVEVKDELGKELLTRNEFFAEMKALRTELESKMQLYFLILLFAMFILNPHAIDLIAKILGVVK